MGDAVIPVHSAIDALIVFVWFAAAGFGWSLGSAIGGILVRFMNRRAGG